MREYLFLAACLLLAACAPKPSMTSPDGRIILDFSCDAGVPSYQVSVDGKPFILPSVLGMEADGADLSGGFAVRKIRHAHVNQTWTQPWGENKSVTDCHKEMSVEIQPHAARAA